ncbi:hypothetical protein ACEN8M_26245 [Duganella sp. CT11-72]|uniref:hypothetical protein n=1 Tax=Duganella sp. CT11-72 TaxID=3243052 RepID=UPI0039AEC358
MDAAVSQVQIVGLSHVNAVRGALARDPAALPCPVQVLHMLSAVPSRRFVVDEDGAPQLDPGLRATVRAVADSGKLVFSQVGGNTHHFFGLMRHPQPFDFMLPERPALALDDGARLLTCGYVRAALRHMMQAEFDMLAALANATRAPLCHLESPPPISDNGYCERLLPASFQPWIAQGRRVAAPALRYKLWRLHSGLVAAECHRLGIGFLPCPPDAMDEDGFLLPPYWFDPLHGNADYGALLLRQLAQRIRRTDAPAPPAHG